MSERLISIILPVHNEAEYLQSAIEQYQEVLNPIPNPYEIILVPNGCRDNSMEVCDKLAHESPNVRVVVSEHGGWGLAVQRGLAEAQGEIICYTNLARTEPRDLLLHLLYAVAYPEVVIKANRKVRDNWRRRLGSLLYNLECRALFDVAFWDINGTPKVFPRKFEKLMQLSSKDDLIDAEFNYVCRREEYPMLEVPIFSKGRHGGTSTTSYGSAVRLYSGAYRMWRQLKKNGMVQG